MVNAQSESLFAQARQAIVDRARGLAWFHLEEHGDDPEISALATNPRFGELKAKPTLDAGEQEELSRLVESTIRLIHGHHQQMLTASGEGNPHS